MTTTVFDNETTATSQIISNVSHLQMMVFIGGPGADATSIKVDIKPANGLGIWYRAKIIIEEDVQTIRCTKNADLRFTIADATSGVSVEVHPMI